MFLVFANVLKYFSADLPGIIQILKFYIS